VRACSCCRAALRKSWPWVLAVVCASRGSRASSAGPGAMWVLRLGKNFCLFRCVSLWPAGVEPKMFYEFLLWVAKIPVAQKCILRVSEICLASRPSLRSGLVAWRFSWLVPGTKRFLCSSKSDLQHPPPILGVGSPKKRVSGPVGASMGGQRLKFGPF
jgi:hypothetical protein